MWLIEDVTLSLSKESLPSLEEGTYEQSGLA